MALINLTFCLQKDPTASILPGNHWILNFIWLWLSYFAAYVCKSYRKYLLTRACCHYPCSLPEKIGHLFSSSPVTGSQWVIRWWESLSSVMWPWSMCMCVLYRGWVGNSGELAETQEKNKWSTHERDSSFLPILLCWNAFVEWRISSLWDDCRSWSRLACIYLKNSYMIHSLWSLLYCASEEFA